MDAIPLSAADALLIVDVQTDFLPNGNLAVPAGDEVVPVLNRYIDLFVRRGLPVYATRDWHPADHCSFVARGGIWPPHCIANTAGAAFAAGLHLPDDAVIVSKATTPQKDAYSGFDGTTLAEQLASNGIARLFIGGLATDYCVRQTVNDALSAGFKVGLLLDAIRAVNLHAGDGEAAIAEMIEHGAKPFHFNDIGREQDCGFFSQKHTGSLMISGESNIPHRWRDGWRC